MTLTPAAEFRLVAGIFSDRVDGVRPEGCDLSAPAPGWTARDVVGHLVGWLPELLDDPASYEPRLANPHIGEVAVDDAITIYSSSAAIRRGALASRIRGCRCR